MGNVFLNGDVKHGEFLENRRKERVIVVAVKLADIFSVKQYASFGRVKETAHKLHERCFACAVKTDNCKLFTRMNGQVNVRERVFICLRIAEGNIIEPDFVLFVRFKSDSFAAVKVERLIPIKKFANRGNIKALLVHYGKLIKNLNDPLCKAAQCRKVQKKLGGRQSVFDGDSDKKRISDAVAQKSQNDINDICPNIFALALCTKRTVQAHCAAPKLFQPAAQAEHADILSKLARCCGFVCVFDSFCKLKLFAAMEIAPFVDAFACKIADSRCCGNKCGKPKVKVRQQSKIDDKADA